MKILAARHTPFHFLRRPEPNQHRQECLCHIDPAIRDVSLHTKPLWHRHSCLCFRKMQWLMLNPRMKSL
jgi:hypothetical protein